MSEIEQGLALWEQTGGALVDLRDSDDYGAGHVPFAIHVDPQDVKMNVPPLADTGETVYLYCYSGMRALQAEALLQAMGYDNVRAIGGIDGYRGELSTFD